MPEQGYVTVLGDLAMPGNARNGIPTPGPLWANEQVGNSRQRDTYVVTCTMAPTSA